LNEALVFLEKSKVSQPSNEQLVAGWGCYRKTHKVVCA
jgi:hypothetical protein